MHLVLLICTLLLTLTKRTNGSPSMPNCSSHFQCRECVEDTESNCVWVVYKRSEADANRCEPFMNQTLYANDTEQCNVCSFTDTTLGFSDVSICNPQDVAIIIVTPLCFLLAAIVFTCLSRIKLNALIQELAKRHEEDEFAADENFDSVKTDWVWFYMFCAPCTISLCMVRPSLEFIFCLPVVAYILVSIVYGFFKFGVPRAIELYTYHFELARNALSCQIEGRLGNERIDNWNRYHMSCFVADTEPGEALEYLEYATFSSKLFSQFFGIVPMGYCMSSFMLGLVGMEAPGGLGRTGGFLAFPAVFYLLVCLGTSSDSLLIITNNRYYYSENYFFVSLFSWHSSGQIDWNVERTGTIYEKNIPIARGKSFFHGSTFRCYFHDSENFTEYLASKNFEVERAYMCQYLFMTGLMVSVTVLLALDAVGVYYVIGQSIPFPLSIAMLVVSAFCFIPMHVSASLSRLKWNQTIAEENAKRETEESQPLLFMRA